MPESGIFNVLAHNLSTDNLPGDNVTALQNLVDLLLSADGPTNRNGGTITFPMVSGESGLGTYEFNDTINIGATDGSKNPANIIFRGTCPGSYDESSSTPVPVLKMVDNPVPLFYINSGEPSKPDDNIAGIAFEDLEIKYDASLLAPAGSAVAAIQAASNAQNIRVSRCVFIDCPTAVWFQGSEQGSMLECTVVGGSNIDACVILGDDPLLAIETYIAACVFRSAFGGVGVRIHNTEHVRMMNVRLEGFKYGIYIQPKGTSFRNHFTNISAFQDGGDATAGGAVVIQPQAGGTVKETVFVGCDFGATDGDSTKLTTGGVYVDATVGTIDTVRFVSCQSINWPGPGLQIVSGSNVEVLGGQYSGNGRDLKGGGSSPYQYGIAITGPATNVRLIGVSCAGTVLGLPEKQQVGIYVSNGATHVLIRGCDATGNAQFALFIGKGGGTSPDYVYVSDCDFTGYGGNSVEFDHPGTHLKIANCAGYNDKHSLLTTTPPGLGTFSSATFGYYGPVTFYASGGAISQIAINGVNTHLTSGAFTIDPEETAQLTYSGVPAFVMIGK